MTNGILLAGMYQLAVTNLDDAQRSFDAVLIEKKTNIVALVGKVRNRHLALWATLKLCSRLVLLSHASNSRQRSSYTNKSSL